jgi:hypothetical protein
LHMGASLRSADADLTAPLYGRVVVFAHADFLIGLEVRPDPTGPMADT